MKMRPAALSWILAATIALVATLPPSDAIAGKGDKVSARVNGRNLRYHAKKICDGFTPGAVSFVAAPRRYHLGQTVRTIAVACPLDLTTTSFPVTPPFCSIGYTEIRVKVPPTAKEWGGSSEAVQVTFTSFDGTHVAGTFSGTLQPEAGATSTASVASGKFSLNLPDDDCTGAAVAGN
jgi:hypothetical protein